MEQLAWNLLLFSIALFVAKIVFGIIDERDESKREKERAAREAERRQQERQRDIEKTIDTVRSGKWIYGRISTDDWSEDVTWLRPLQDNLTLMDLGRVDLMFVACGLLLWLNGPGKAALQRR